MSEGSVSLARALSRSGVCSRKLAVCAIRDGRVCVDGVMERNPDRKVERHGSSVTLDGRDIAAVPRLVLAFHKPTGVVTTRCDPAGRLTVYDVLGDVGAWVFPVGRLDRDTSGLLIFTNDARIGARLTDPRRHVPKTYHARVRATPSPAALAALAEGISLPDGTSTRPAVVRALGHCRDGSSWVEIVVTEGRNRQVRRMCSAVGHDVVDLVRVGIGDLPLGQLPLSQWQRLGPDDVERLCRPSLGTATSGR